MVVDKKVSNIMVRQWLGRCQAIFPQTEHENCSSWFPDQKSAPTGAPEPFRHYGSAAQTEEVLDLLGHLADRLETVHEIVPTDSPVRALVVSPLHQADGRGEGEIADPIGDAGQADRIAQGGRQAQLLLGQVDQSRILAPPPVMMTPAGSSPLRSQRFSSLSTAFC